jgi:hypothetical protein
MSSESGGDGKGSGAVERNGVVLAVNGVVPPIEGVRVKNVCEELRHVTKATGLKSMDSRILEAGTSKHEHRNLLPCMFV